MTTATPRTRAIVLHMLDALEAPSRELTKWEEGFLDSQCEKAERPRWLPSEREFEIFEGIYAEKTS